MLAAALVAVVRTCAMPHPTWWAVVPTLLCLVSGAKLLLLARAARTRCGRAAREQSDDEREWETTAIMAVVSCGLLDLPGLVALGIGWHLWRDRR